jgi:hypothetical protein
MLMQPLIIAAQSASAIMGVVFTPRERGRVMSESLLVASVRRHVGQPARGFVRLSSACDGRSSVAEAVGLRVFRTIDCGCAP